MVFGVIRLMRGFRLFFGQSGDHSHGARSGQTFLSFFFCPIFSTFPNKSNHHTLIKSGFRDSMHELHQLGSQDLRLRNQCWQSASTVLPFSCTGFGPICFYYRVCFFPILYKTRRKFPILGVGSCSQNAEKKPCYESLLCIWILTFQSIWPQTWRRMTVLEFRERKTMGWFDRYENRWGEYKSCINGPTRLLTIHEKLLTV